MKNYRRWNLDGADLSDQQESKLYSQIEFLTICENKLKVKICNGISWGMY